MAPWLDWFILASSLVLMLAGLRDRRSGGRLAIVSAMLAATAAARLVPDTAQTMRIALWIVSIALMVYMLAIAIIWVLQIPSLPRAVQIVLLVALVLIVAAVPVVAIARTTKP